MDWIVEEQFPQGKPKRMTDGCWVDQPANDHHTPAEAAAPRVRPENPKQKPDHQVRLTDS